MSVLTRHAIMESFLRLVGRKTLDKITVRDIVDECGINRNTFYYHFQDIYAVLEALCSELFGRLPRDASLAEAMTAFLTSMSHFAGHYPRSTHGLIVSLGYDGFHRYIAPDLNKLVLECLQRSGATDAYAQERHLALFISHAVLGIAVDLLKSDTPVDVACVIDDMTDILKRLDPPDTP